MRRRRPGRATHGALKSRTQMLGDALGLAWKISPWGRLHGPQAVTSWFSDWNRRSWRSPREFIARESRCAALSPGPPDI